MRRGSRALQTNSRDPHGEVRRHSAARHIMTTHPTKRHTVASSLGRSNLSWQQHAAKKDLAAHHVVMRDLTPSTAAVHSSEGPGGEANGGKPCDGGQASGSTCHKGVNGGREERRFQGLITTYRPQFEKKIGTYLNSAGQTVMEKPTI